jgi:hypothetical protein
MASSKFEEAVALVDGPQRQQIIKIGARLSQLGGDEGWLSKDLQGEVSLVSNLAEYRPTSPALTGILSVAIIYHRA